MLTKIYSYSDTKFLINRFLFLGALTMGLTSCACSDNRKPEVKDKDNRNNNQAAMLGEVSSPQVKVTKAVANVKSLGDHHINGVVEFILVQGGIKVIGDVEGLTPGKHGFHVHEHGDCGGKEGAAAGGHFNPTNSKHGGPDSEERHVGDLGNFEANDKGFAHYERVDTLIALEGPHSIIGRSIIIHADPDDYTTQPTGASGARVACGIIEAVAE